MDVFGVDEIFWNLFVSTSLKSCFFTWLELLLAEEFPPARTTF